MAIPPDGPMCLICRAETTEGSNICLQCFTRERESIEKQEGISLSVICDELEQFDKHNVPPSA